MKVPYGAIKVGDVLMTRHKNDDEHTAVRRECFGKVRGTLLLKEVHAGRDTEVKHWPYEEFVRIEFINKEK